MIDSLADTARLRELLVNDYRKLPALKQKIVQLFSVIHEPLNRTSFMACLNQIGIKDVAGACSYNFY
ncbi:hypothetical protein [Scytonema sp. PCC 10023]|uniref:hypothetical protein n=1 Tax=Scytonema sp. PCC 10023 TaxID=1680591 RepID=UPI0039C687CC